MLSVLFAESGDCFAHLARFYHPQADKVLDVTYGNGTLTKRCGLGVVGIDKDVTTRASVYADAKQLPFLSGTFDLACFDPPYLYGSLAMHMGPIGTKTWSNVRSTWKRPQQLAELSAGVGAELFRVLRHNGTVIVKIMDSRFRGRLILNHELVAEAFEAHRLVLVDVIVYVRTVTGSFVNTKTAQSAHGYYLIFRKERQQQKRLPYTEAMTA